MNMQQYYMYTPFICKYPNYLTFTNQGLTIHSISLQESIMVRKLLASEDAIIYTKEQCR